MQTLTPLAIGTDIGRSGFHLCVADPTISPKKWSVLKIDYADADWWQIVVQLVGQRPAIFVAEPTGWHYLAPLAQLLHSQCPNATLHLINHDASRRIRQAYLSRSNKTDAIDARALALVALDLTQGREPVGIRNNSLEAAQHILELRMQVNKYTRLVRAQTKLLNRFEQWSFSIWPALADHKDTYLRAALEGAITPDQLREFAANYPDRRVTRWTEEMNAKLPDFVVCPPIVEEALAHIVNEYHSLPTEIETAAAQISPTLELPQFQTVAARWRTIPAASDTQIAALLVAAQGRVLEMTRDEFRASVGVAPARQQSGKSDTGKKSRRGYRPALQAVHMWTMTLLSPNIAPNPIRRHQDRRPYLARTKTKFADLLWFVARDPNGYRYQPGQSRPDNKKGD